MNASFCISYMKRKRRFSEEGDLDRVNDLSRDIEFAHSTLTSLSISRNSHVYVSNIISGDVDRYCLSTIIAVCAVIFAVYLIS